MFLYNKHIVQPVKIFDSIPTKVTYSFFNMIEKELSIIIYVYLILKLNILIDYYELIISYYKFKETNKLL